MATARETGEGQDSAGREGEGLHAWIMQARGGPRIALPVLNSDWEWLVYGVLCGRVCKPLTIAVGGGRVKTV